MNYSWHVLKLGLQDELNHEGQLLENAIVNIKWKRVAQDTDGTMASYIGNTKLSAVNVSADNFVALNQVTNTMALQWVENSLSEKEVVRIDEQLNNKVDRNRVRNIRPNW